MPPNRGGSRFASFSLQKRGWRSKKVAIRLLLHSASGEIAEWKGKSEKDVEKEEDKQEEEASSSPRPFLRLTTVSPKKHATSRGVEKTLRGGGSWRKGGKVVMFLFCLSFPRKPRRKRIKKAW